MGVEQRPVRLHLSVQKRARPPLDDDVLPAAETAVLAGSLKDEGFTIIATCPGWVETDMGTRSSKEMDVRCYQRTVYQGVWKGIRV